MRWLAVLLFALTFSSINAGEKDKKSPDEKPKINAGEKDKKSPDEKAKVDNALIIIPPAGGKEVKLVDWRFTLGTRQLALDGEPVTKTSGGTEYLEFREEKSTTYDKGILTLIPIASLKKISYEREKKNVAVEVLAAGGKIETLAGTTKYLGINKLTLEAEALLDGLGAATVKFQGGVDKVGLHSIAFPNPKPAREPKGPAFLIQADDKEKTKHTVQDLQPLWLIDGAYKIQSFMMFKKTVKVDVDKIASIKFIPSSDKKKISYDYEVTLKDGAVHHFTLLTTAELDKKRSMTFAGLIGRTPIGLKLFPAHTINELTRVDAKKD